MRGSIARRVDAKGKAGYFVVIEERADGGKRRRRWHSDPATGSAFTSRKAAEAKKVEVVNAVNMAGTSSPTRSAWRGGWISGSRSSGPQSGHRPGRHTRRTCGCTSSRGSGRSRCSASARPTWTPSTPRSSTADVLIIEQESRCHRGRSGTSTRFRPRAEGRHPEGSDSPVIPPLTPTTPRPRRQPAVMRTWNPGEMSGFWKHLRRRTDTAPLLAFLARTGCRRGEAIALKLARRQPGRAARVDHTFGGIPERQSCRG